MRRSFFDRAGFACLIAVSQGAAATMVKFVIDYAKTEAAPSPDGRLDAPAFHRNHEPIWSAISDILTKQTGHVLELGSGTGQHVVTFARRTPQLTWWP